MFFSLARLLLLLDAATLEIQDDLKSVLVDLAGTRSGVGSSVFSVLLACSIAVVLNLAIGFQHRWRIAREETSKDRQWWRVDLREWWLESVGRWWKASRNYSQDRAISQSGNALQKLLHRAAEAGAEEGLLLALTLSSRRTYAGWVTLSPSLSPSETFISLVPLMSGYRREHDLSLEWDFAYPLETILDLGAENAVVLALPIDEIRSAHLLDEDYWSQEQARLLDRSSESNGPSLPP